MNELKLAIWNANGLAQHKLEVQNFLIDFNIDIMLVSETHFTNSSYLKFKGYHLYNTNRPDGKAYGGTAIIIKKRIKHYELEKYREEHIQATSICLEEWTGKCTISAVYCPPKHPIKTQEFANYFKTLGDKFIAGGDYNAKHTQWGSRLITPKGKQLWDCIQREKLDHISSGHPTYWPTDRKKIPDLVDFCVSRGIARHHVRADTCYDLSSDHSPILITLCKKVLRSHLPRTLTNQHTNWAQFTSTIARKCSLSISLKTNDEIEEAVKNVTDMLKEAATDATPNFLPKVKTRKPSENIQQLLMTKRAIRRQWQLHRSPALKAKLNKAIKNLKKALLQESDEGFQNYLDGLTATESTDYSLWKATRKLKRPTLSYSPIRHPDGNWARSDADKAIVFAEYLSKVFTPNEQMETSELPSDVEKTPENQSIKFKWSSVRKTIKENISPKKAPGHDFITGKILKELPEKCIKLITYIFNAIIKTGYFPETWKISQIIMIPKPGKDVTKVNSYRPISLLPTLSKLFEKMLLKKLKPIMHEKRIIPDHQFGFREEHGTVEQVHRVVSEIRNSLEQKKYCSAAFIDIAQAFDKVWHKGLLHKVRNLLPARFYAIIENYLVDRKFFIKYNSAFSNLYEIHAGVPQGSVLGPVLYLLYTADLPTSNYVKVSTFADDTAVLASHHDPTIASRYLQKHLNEIESWLSKWRIKANELKSGHITFTLRKLTCPPVKLNNITLPQHQTVKYLGLHLDRRLTWKQHIETKRKQIKLKCAQMNWLIGTYSKLSLDCKVLLYKMILKPIWTYGIQLWGSACTSNIIKLERMQSKILRMIVNAPWYVRNTNIHRDLQIETVADTIKEYSKKYQLKLEQHPNALAREILKRPRYRRLQKKDPLDLAK